jgi:hypothetical protein
MTADQPRSMMRDAHDWRDLLWHAVLREYQTRSPQAAEAAREAIRLRRVRRLRGASTFDAASAWSFLDHQARMDWLWACEFVHQVWFRGHYEQPAHARAPASLHSEGRKALVTGPVK